MLGFKKAKLGENDVISESFPSIQNIFKGDPLSHPLSTNEEILNSSITSSTVPIITIPVRAIPVLTDKSSNPYVTQLGFLDQQELMVLSSVGVPRGIAEDVIKSVKISSLVERG